MSQAENKVIPEGYKQTDIGVIPENWDVITLDDAANFLDGQRRPVKSGDRARIKGQYPYYGASGIVDYVNDYIFDGEFILLGEDGENILSRNLPLAFRANGKIWVNNHAHVMIPKSNFHIDFLTSYLESLDYSLLNSGTAQPKLNKQACLNIKVLRPSLKEQTAIANALSDVDALLSELEKLIAKKQAIKTATMQQLLTGKTRLPQFAFYSDINSTEGAVEGKRKGTKPSELGEIPEDWDVVTIGDFAPLQRGFDLTNTNRREGIYPVVYSNGIVNHHAHFQIKGPGVVTGRSGTLGKVHYIDTDYWPHNTSLWVTKFEISNPKYVYYLYKHIGFERFASGSGVPTLNRNDAHDFKITVPPTKEEQTAIATILSDMDNEIQTHEQRLSKTSQIKQGMMQELLTGKTRLPLGTN
ncbi:MULTISPECIES: restriction endonuclease subunit S [unclassified Shewanella]|uniref:restriction endonuclease subunit S n=1 Tax=Shewanella TaxID=22 RepID=UPI0021D8E912|nr:MULTISPECIES: restriction endonuclease subunit S [unclassified Shewanella]MCU8033684.1 restriction endonuclease subunit S [Shewanella sp. SM71]MCU8095607.1 restriction endonuclease subunit S [Shewanella sp. SM102]